MSKKVTGKELELMLERMNIKFHRKKQGKPPVDFFNQSTQDDGSDPKVKDSIPLTSTGKVGVKQTKAYNSLKTLASAEQAKDVLDDSDIEKYLEDNDWIARKAVIAIDKVLKFDGKKAFLGNFLVPEINRIAAEHWEEVATQAFNSGMGEEFANSFNNLTSRDDQIKAGTETAYMAWLRAKASPRTPAELHQTIVKQVRASGFARQEPFGTTTSKLPKSGTETTMANWNAGVPNVQAPRELVYLFDSIKGETVAEKLKEIKDFMLAINKGPTATKAWINENDDFALLNYSNIVSILADAPKNFRAIEAGYEFERWLALVFDFPIVGGDNSATDNIGRVTSGVNETDVYTSAKYYTDPCLVSQSFDELNKTFDDNGGKSIYYFVMLKTGKGDFNTESKDFAHSGLDLFLLEISRDGNQIYASFIGPDGDAKEKYPLVKDPKDDNQLLLFPCYGSKLSDRLSGKEFFSIPVLSEEFVKAIGSDASAKTADYLSWSIRNGGLSKIAEKIVDVYNRLQTIDAKTTDYRTSKAEGSKRDSGGYVRKISKEYKALKDDLNQVFTTAGESGKIDESKKITAKMLQKLIEEKFKK